MSPPTFPFFVLSPRDRRAEYGGSIQFTARAIGRPPPLVTWYKEGKRIEDTAREEVEQSGRHQSASSRHSWRERERVNPQQICDCDLVTNLASARQLNPIDGVKYQSST